MNIAEKLKKLRESKGISQNKLIEELAEKQNVNVAISSIRNYENINSPRIPQGEALLALARYYDVNLEYLIDDNITTYKKENLDIGMELGLNDSAIDTIHDFSTLNCIDMLNFFLTDDFAYELFPSLKLILEISSFIKYSNSIINKFYSCYNDSFFIEEEEAFSNEENINMFIKELNEKILILKKFTDNFISKNIVYLCNEKYELIFKSLNFDNDLFIIRTIIDGYDKISALEEKKSIVRLITQNIYHITTKLDTIDDIIRFNITNLFNTFLNFDENVKYREKIYNNIINDYATIEEIITKVGDNNVSKRDRKE